MAAITNFKARILDLTGTLVGEDDTDAMEQFILDGCYDVIAKLNQMKIFNYEEFITASSNITSGVGTDTDDIREIFNVERNGLPCRKIRSGMRSFAASSNSIYEATANDPVYYYFNNQVFILPDSTTNEVGVLYHLPEYSLNSLTSSSAIDKFPNQYYEHILLYASFMILGKQLLSLIQDTTDATDLSMDTIAQMMNADKPDSGGDIWDYLRDEDTEMVQSTLQAMTGAMAVTKQKYDWYGARMQDIRGQYMSQFGASKKQ